jgi:hypothetical protein
VSHVILLYEPDEDCVDPLDPQRSPRRHYDVVSDDAIVVWFQPHGDPDGEGGEVGHIIGFGRFENVTNEQVREAINTMLDVT